MRVDAAAIVARDPMMVQVHALLLGAGARLNPLARAWFVSRGVIRVSLVWRSRLNRVSHVTTVTLRAADLA